ncbi:hypothetical protein HYS50_01395 [Candidatus Woesearchaeota archaeon]|nr:hypothetical protein [Candidatus Woesearchaeota archaeon]
MGIIKDYMLQRRQKKLEEVTRALEQLKHENVATDSLKPKTTPSHQNVYSPLRSGREFLFIGILLVCVVVLIVLSFYYRSQFTSINDEYQEKVDKLETLETELQEKLQDLNETKTLLKDKETSEKDFLKDQDRLEAEIEYLKNEIKTLEADIAAKRDELDNLTKTVSDQKREIAKWKNCIEDELNENLSVCD